MKKGDWIVSRARTLKKDRNKFPAILGQITDINEFSIYFLPFDFHIVQGETILKFEIRLATDEDMARAITNKINDVEKPWIVS